MSGDHQEASLRFGLICTGSASTADNLISGPPFCQDGWTDLKSVDVSVSKFTNIAVG